MMDLARDPSNMSHPLVVPPAGTPADGNVTQQASGDDQLIPAKTGEYVIPEPVVRAKGTQFFDNLIKKVLQDPLPPTDSGEPQDPASQAGTGTPQTGYQWGGEVTKPGAINDSFNLPEGGGRGFNFSYGDPNRGNFINKWNDVPSYDQPASLPPPPPQPPDPNVTTFTQNNPPTPPTFQGDDHPSGNTSGSAARSDTYLNRIGEIYSGNPYTMGTLPQGGAGYLPPSNLPGSVQGPVAIPSYFDPQGYPWAQPASADWNTGTIAGLPPKKKA
jgi:hypothetical protein